MYGVNETDYKGCTIKTMENEGGLYSWSWKIDTSTSGLTIICDEGSAMSESQAIREAKSQIDDAIRDTW